MDAADNDPQRFRECLDAALSAAQDDRLELPDSGEPAVSHLDELVASGERFSVFLDDVHVITDPGVLGLIRDLSASIPAQGTLVLGGRSVPELRLAWMRSQGRVLDVDADALRFTTGESEHLVANILGLLQEDVGPALAGQINALIGAT